MPTGFCGLSTPSIRPLRRHVPLLRQQVQPFLLVPSSCTAAQELAAPAVSLSSMPFSTHCAVSSANLLSPRCRSIRHRHRPLLHLPHLGRPWRRQAVQSPLVRALLVARSLAHRRVASWHLDPSTDLGHLAAYLRPALVVATSPARTVTRATHGCLTAVVPAIAVPVLLRQIPVTTYL